MGNRIVEYSLKVLFTILAILAIYWLYTIIREPIIAKQRKQKRKKMVIDRLEKSREAQKTYKDHNGEYTASWDTLMNFVKHDTIPVIKTKGDPNDTTQTIKRDTNLIPVKQKLFPDYEADSIQYAPMTGEKFEMDAGTITMRGVDVKVFEIKDVKPINDDKTLKVGSMKKGNTSGNW